MNNVPGTGLKKDISTGQLLTLFAGTMIGSGWMVGVTGWLEAAGTGWAVAAFAVGTVCMCCIALCTMELALAYPQSGGEFVYVFEGLGSVAAFAVGWTLAFLFTVWSIFQAIVSAWLICEIVPAFEGPTLYTVSGQGVALGHLVIGAIGTCWLAWVNFRGSKSTMRVQDLMTYVLAVAVSGIFVLAFSQGSGTNITTSAMATPGGFAGFISVLIAVPVWFSAFTLVLQALGELESVDEPKKIARLVVAPVAGLGVFYVLVIVSTAYGASLDSLKHTGFAPLAVVTGNRWGEYFILGVALLGILTGWNAAFFGASRVLFALGRSRMIPIAFGKTNPTHGSPASAVMFVCAVTLVGIFSGRATISTLLSALAIAQPFVYVLVCVSLIRLRTTQPMLGRPVRVPAYPWIPIAALVVSILAVISAAYLPFKSLGHSAMPTEWILLLVWIVTGALFWRLEKKLRNSISIQERTRLVHTR